LSFLPISFKAKSKVIIAPPYVAALCFILMLYMSRLDFFACMNPPPRFEWLVMSDCHFRLVSKWNHKSQFYHQMLLYYVSYWCCTFQLSSSWHRQIHPLKLVSLFWTTDDINWFSCTIFPTLKSNTIIAVKAIKWDEITWNHAKMGHVTHSYEQESNHLIQRNHYLKEESIGTCR
jgi:hypothetical protein